MEFFFLIMGLLLGIFMRDISEGLTNYVMSKVTSRKRKKDIIKNTIKQLEEHANEEDQV